MHVWALCRDQEELNPNAAWRLLDMSASSTEQILWEKGSRGGGIQPPAASRTRTQKDRGKDCTFVTLCTRSHQYLKGLCGYRWTYLTSLTDVQACSVQLYHHRTGTFILERARQGWWEWIITWNVPHTARFKNTPGVWETCRNPKQARYLIKLLFVKVSQETSLYSSWISWNLRLINLSHWLQMLLSWFFFFCFAKNQDLYKHCSTTGRKCQWFFLSKVILARCILLHLHQNQMWICAEIRADNLYLIDNA